MTRRLPNVLITGTPGTGKSTFSQELLAYLNEAFVDAGRQPAYRVIEVGKLVKESQLYSEWDEERRCTVFDSDRVHDALEEELTHPTGGVIVDFHSTDPVDAEWFDFLVLLRTSTAVLWDRLAARGYSEVKIKENVEAEIMNVVKEELLDMLDDPSRWGPGSDCGVDLANGHVEVLNDDFEAQQATVVQLGCAIMRHVSSSQ